MERQTEIRTPDGIARGFLYTAEGGAQSPGVIQLTDIRGIRPASRDFAKTLAARGFTVLLPNVYYRTEEAPLWDVNHKPGDESSEKRFAELRAPLTPDAMQRDGASFVDYLGSQEGVKAGPMGVVGFCFTRSMAMRIAALSPDQIPAAASFHGGRLFVDSPASPHLLLPKIKARLYFGHAVEDRGMPKEAIAKFEEALQTWGGKFESETYDGARHGWTQIDSGVYNQPQAERAFEKLGQLFDATLK